MNKWTNQIKAALSQTRHAAKRHGPEMTDDQRRARATLLALRDEPAHLRIESAVRHALSEHATAFKL